MGSRKVSTYVPSVVPRGRNRTSYVGIDVLIRPSGRDITTLLNVSHASPKDYTPSTPETTIFAGNNSCVLSPEVTEGPYYVAGEYIRQNVPAPQAGVPLTVDIQVVDISTCEPVEGVYLKNKRALTLSPSPSP